MRLPDRLAALWNHLGLGAAHIAAGMPVDVVEFCAAHPDRVAGLAFCAPSRLDTAAFAPLAARLLLISGDRGMTANLAEAATRQLGNRHAVLADYEALGWSDVVADRGPAITGVLQEFLTQPATPPRAMASSGAHAGITYRITGQGPALVLLPFMLAPSQWDPALRTLAQTFTVIVLGGPHIGGIAALEDRATAPSYRAMIRTLFDIIAPKPGETILDIGCGSGALDRMLAERFGPANKITATDVNPFLLREAAALATDLSINFQKANAEALPFPAGSFDCIYSVTVLEECDADKALAEIHRTLRPGGRVGIVVRAIDMSQWWHLDLPDDIRRKVTAPPQSVGPRGVADASLYSRMRHAGFRHLTHFPSLVTLDNPDGPIWRYREEHALSQLTESEATVWRKIAGDARAAGTLFQSHPMHCAVGVKA